MTQADACLLLLPVAPLLCPEERTIMAHVLETGACGSPVQHARLMGLYAQVRGAGLVP